MKVMIRPVCQRCGYRYDPKEKRRVLVFQCEDGEPQEALIFEGVCNYQDSAKTVLTADKRLIQLSAQAYFIGDIAPSLPVISGGEVTVFGEVRRIAQGMKARNPDGTVNYTRIDLI